MKYSGVNTLTEMIVKTKEYVNSAIAGLYTPAGSVAFANLPALSSSVLGYVYDVSDDFTTDNRFVEPVGKSYPAHTNVVVVQTGSDPAVYKFDVLTGMFDFHTYVVASPDASGLPDIATPDTKTIYLVPITGGYNMFFYNGTNFVKINIDVEDAIINGYFNDSDDLFYEESTFVTPITGATNKMYVDISEDKTYRYNGTIFVRLDGDGSGGGSLDNAITASVSVGGIQSGKNFPVGTSFQDMWQQLIDPVQFPTLTNPSASISGGTTLLETGASVSRTISASFSRGSINPAYGTSGYRSGAAVDYALNGGTAQAGNSFTQTVSESNKTFKIKVNYGAGEQPKDSKGNDYNSPLPAGYVETSTLTYSFVDAMWANTASIDTIAKLSLVAKSSGQRDLVFPAQTVANPETFDIPASWTVTAVEVKNDMSGAYEEASAQFTVTDTTHDNAAGTSVAYKRYTFNLGYPTGSRTVRVKFS